MAQDQETIPAEVNTVQATKIGRHACLIYKPPLSTSEQDILDANPPMSVGFTKVKLNAEACSLQIIALAQFGLNAEEKRSGFAHYAQVAVPELLPSRTYDPTSVTLSGRAVTTQIDNIRFANARSLARPIGASSVETNGPFRTLLEMEELGMMEKSTLDE